MISIEKVKTADLELGMYVSSLDRPWLETPFLLQGFRIESEGEIHKLRDLCQYVYVDNHKSVPTPVTAQRGTLSRRRRSPQELFGGRALRRYRDQSNWDEEFPRASAALEELSEGIEAVFVNVSRGGALDLKRVRKSVEPMIDSISRNPDACIWLAQIKQQDRYTYQHSLGASIWAVALGRQLGLPREDLSSLAVGGLLFDVGKLRVDPTLLRADRALTEAELGRVRDHVGIGLALIRESGLSNQNVLDMVAHHHERHNGSGYPDGLRGDDIPIFARIAAIVDCYDAITSHHEPSRAIAAMPGRCRPRLPSRRSTSGAMSISRRNWWRSLSRPWGSTRRGPWWNCPREKWVWWYPSTGPGACARGSCCCWGPTSRHWTRRR
jgi:HD-GYP domain-containing protein (c-di-GMP phosphodiesterase class II)